jgi:hypothetical protein
MPAGCPSIESPQRPVISVPAFIVYLQISEEVLYRGRLFWQFFPSPAEFVQYTLVPDYRFSGQAAGPA